MRLELLFFFLVTLFLVSSYSAYTSPYDFVDTRGQWGVAFNGSYPSAEFFIVDPNSNGATSNNNTDSSDGYYTYDERASPAYRLNQTFQMQLLRLYEVNGTGSNQSIVWNARSFPASVESSTNTLSALYGANRVRNVSFIYNFFLKGSVYVTYMISENASTLTDEFVNPLGDNGYDGYYPLGNSDRRIQMSIQVLNWFFQTPTSQLGFEMLLLVNNSKTTVPRDPYVPYNYSSPSLTARPSRTGILASRTSRPSLLGSQSVFASFSPIASTTPSRNFSPTRSISSALSSTPSATQTPVLSGTISSILPTTTASRVVGTLTATQTPILTATVFVGKRQNVGTLTATQTPVLSATASSVLLTTTASPVVGTLTATQTPVLSRTASSISATTTASPISTTLTATQTPVLSATASSVLSTATASTPAASSGTATATMTNSRSYNDFSSSDDEYGTIFTNSYNLDQTASTAFARYPESVSQLDSQEYSSNTSDPNSFVTIYNYPAPSGNGNDTYNYVNVLLPRFARSATYGPSRFSLGIPNAFLYGVPDYSSIGRSGKIAIAITIGVAGILACCALILFVLLILIGAKIVENIRGRREREDRSVAYRSRDDMEGGRTTFATTGKE